MLILQGQLTLVSFPGLNKAAVRFQVDFVCV